MCVFNHNCNDNGNTVGGLLLCCGAAFIGWIVAMLLVAVESLKMFGG